MPQYGTQARGPVSLAPGQQIALVNNAAVDAGVTQSIPVAVAQTSSGHTPTLGIVNTTTEEAVVCVAAVDAEANYQALTNADTSEPITVSGSSAIVFTCVGPFLCVKFQTAPATGSLTITR